MEAAGAENVSRDAISLVHLLFVHIGNNDTDHYHILNLIIIVLYGQYMRRTYSDVIWVRNKYLVAKRKILYIYPSYSHLSFGIQHLKTEYRPHHPSTT